jgi:hypothetical protein
MWPSARISAIAVSSSRRTVAGLTPRSGGAVGATGGAPTVCLGRDVRYLRQEGFSIRCL